MRLITRPAAVLAFFLIAFVPVLIFVVNGAWPGQLPPALEAPAPFPKQFGPYYFRAVERWFSDRIGLRPRLIALGSNLQVIVLRRSISKQAFFSQDGWFFWSDIDPSSQGRQTTVAALLEDARGQIHFSTQEMQRFNSELRKIRDTLAACGKTVLVVFAPHKQSIYPEKILGERASYPETRLDDLLKRVDPELRSMIIDPRPTLRAVKAANKFPVYSAGDTHWNGLGNFLVYKDVIDALNKIRPVHRPELASLDLFDLLMRDGHQGDIGYVLFVPSWFREIEIKLRPKTIVPVIQASSGSDGHLIYENPDGRGNMMVTGDSFSLLLLGSFARHFRKVEHRGRSIGEAIDGDAIRQYQPDVVLIEMVERYMPMMLLAPKNLDRACAK